MISLVLVEDQPDVAAALHLAISSEGDIEVTAICHTLAASVEIIGRDRPDVVLTDFRLSDGDAADRFVEWSAVSPESRVLVLSAWSDDRSVQRARDSGASGYLEKGPDIEGMCSAIRLVATGGEHWLGDESAPSSAAPSPGPQADLGSVAVAHLVAGGRSTAEMMLATGLSERTVRLHVSGLLRHHGVRTRQELREVLAAVYPETADLDEEAPA